MKALLLASKEKKKHPCPKGEIGCACHVCFCWLPGRVKSVQNRLAVGVSSAVGCEKRV